MSDKQDLILTMLYEMKPMVQDSLARIKSMEEAVNSATVRNAEQDIHIKNIKEHHETLREKVINHINNHWAWVGTMAGVLAIIGIFIGYWHRAAKP